ncbi:hypothetical protein [Deinococcus maricopensis]|uniref:Uncharacterized protein n=1 Tax=Deinococcus maricopensis (strain DSM 21211 / LMG 22137 / NRRL B-23946 / LB-34) TaxID=709986 RepID=E8U619_DEIML|nr:hypothetical protein [Deinococcus maricopensis]ADV66508.1 hypothetical protein Deima_0853 [Deinococcus maricopensis DSM 21211]
MTGPSLQNRQQAIDDCQALIDHVGNLHNQGTSIPNNLVTQLEAALINVYTVALSDDAVRASIRNTSNDQGEQAAQVSQQIQALARRGTADLVKAETYDGTRKHLYTEFAHAIAHAAKREEETEN